MALSLDILNTKGEKVGAVDLPETVFGVKGSLSIVHEVVNAYLANERRGTHSTKTRGEVSGGGLKPWKQKHTGRARAGSTRSPLWRHGGVTFGPKPRSYYQAISASKRHLALKIVLSDRVRGGKLSVLDAVAVPEPKTKRVAEIVKKLGLPAKTLLVLDEIQPMFLRAARNFENLRLVRAQHLNSYEVLESSRIVFTRPALDQLVQRLDKDAAAAPAAANG